MRALYTKMSMAVLGFGFLPWISHSQITFQNSNTRLGITDFHSGNSISVVDMDGDGMDDIARMDDGYKLQLQKQKTGQQFVTVNGVNMGGGSAWSMVVGDANEDGYRDVAAGFGSGANLSLSNGTGTGYGATIPLPNSNYFLQNMNFMDVDNDGDVDIFGCNDVGLSKIWVNNGSGVYMVSNIINFDVTVSDDSGNYGSVWSDFDNDGDVDFYIAKCRQGVNDPNDPRRINVLFVNNGNGSYTENAAAYGLRINSQSWTANFDDINNDGWLDVLVTNHDVQTMLMLNDGTGHFTDINVGNGAGLDINFTPYQSKMMDFDNDGWMDILISGESDNSASGRLFRNNHNNTFSAVLGAFPTAENNALHSFGLGDLNHDGKVDIYAGYGYGYVNSSTIDDVLWLNKTNNGNHFAAFTLQGTVSNRDALGARIFLYGDWGVQTREVRAGESYGTCNTFNLYFGLGTASSIDSAIIKWPSGTVTKLYDKPADQFITVIEATCTSPDNKISSTGMPVICEPGDDVTLSAATGTGFTYLWSTGATTQSIVVTTLGEYSVKVTAPGGCSSISPIIDVQMGPDQTPTITALGETRFCAGESITLDGPAGWSGYSWTGGAETEDLEVTESGSYTLTIQGDCQEWTSDPIEVTVLDAAEPVATGGSVLNSGTVTLSATGSDLVWYDDEFAGNQVGTGNTFVTPNITNTTTYYVQSSTQFLGNNYNTAQTDHTGSSAYSGSNTTNAITSFEVLSDCILLSAKVYSDQAGERLVQVKNSGGTVVASALVNIPITTSLPGGSTRIDLNFNLTAGVYTLVTDAATNMTNFGYAGPRLQRSNGGGVVYPYVVPGILSINGSSEGNTLFYYFYDWEISHGTMVCPSERVPAVATVYSNASINELDNAAGINTYPNPTDGLLNIQATKAPINGATLKVLDITGKVVYMERTINWVKNGVKSIDVTGLSSGIYTLEINNGEMNYNAKFIIR